MLPNRQPPSDKQRQWNIHGFIGWSTYMNINPYWSIFKMYSSATEYKIAQRRAKYYRLMRKGLLPPSDKATWRKIIDQACKTHPINRIPMSKRYP